ncbi:acyl-CoA N-acyltransferase [Massarina eburnea CBS 473.64]|uniref:Acyl-CoA N-acyltransferase n=1 Tax=Massarina eburnea CBS 473.64 TaxID=1395130 RepID=A0A6A6RWF8_9PLEO|nr:acyl-CoA N-acyltransferase [Massarina eburnea CBS 473.64]
MTSIHIRNGRFSDLAAISKVMSLAFFDDPFFGEIVHPNRKQYPEDFALYWLRRAHVNFWDYRWRWLVAVEQRESGEEEIVGIAQWERMGKGGGRMECGWWDPRSYLSSLASLIISIHALIKPSRAVNPECEDALERAYLVFGNVWSGDRAEVWYLEWLAVHPDHQGKGIGKQLAQTGLQWAEEEGVWASVASAAGKEAFYRDKCGFDEEYYAANMGEGNPLADLGPGATGRMFWKRPKKLL